jgi:hypothetical protein
MNVLKNVVAVVVVVAVAAVQEWGKQSALLARDRLPKCST